MGISLAREPQYCGPPRVFSHALLQLHVHRDDGGRMAAVCGGRMGAGKTEVLGLRGTSLWGKETIDSNNKNRLLLELQGLYHGLWQCIWNSWES